MEEYVKHVTRGDDHGRAWCGASLANTFSFMDAEHAALNGAKGGRLVACPDCVNSITKALRGESLEAKDGD